MRFSTIAAFATSLVVVAAQTPDLSSIPQCAVPCLIAAIPSSGCGITDIECQCTTGQAALTSSLLSCIPSKCSADDIAKVTPALVGLCSDAGVSVSVPASIATAAQSAASSAASAASSAVSSAASAASSATASRTGSASATSSGPAQSTGGAGANAVGLGAVVLGLFAAAL